MVAQGRHPHCHRPPVEGLVRLTTLLTSRAGSTHGLAVWRFPKLCYQYGGGAFLIPYFLALFFCAIPVVVLEFALGQKFRVGHVALMRQLSPRAVGLGWAACIGTFLIAQFYQALLAITLIYLLSSFTLDGLPWTNGHAHAFFAQTVVKQSAAVDDLAGVVPSLAAAYAVIWAVVGFTYLLPALLTTYLPY